MEVLWAIYVSACLQTTCVSQEVQRVNTQAQCLELLPSYTDLPMDGNWSSVTWECKPLNSQST